jgi:hypothetical protein
MRVTVRLKVVVLEGLAGTVEVGTGFVEVREKIL